MAVLEEQKVELSEGILKNYNVEETLGYLATVFSILVKRKLNAMLKESDLDLSPEQYVVLSTLHWNGSMTLTELANKTFKDNANVTRMVDLMEEKELVRREPSSVDRRAIQLVLTEHGKEVFRHALAHVIHLKSMYSPGLREEHLVELRDRLDQMIKNLFEVLD